MDGHGAGRIGGRNRWRHRAVVRFLKKVPIALLLAFAASAGADDDTSPAACHSNADCKLIYSSCSCVAVPVSDPRTFLPSNVDCPVNVCRVEDISATCEEQVCQPDARPNGNRHPENDKQNRGDLVD